ncbi:MAG: TRAP transporter permease [Geminicoccaceae bacterium]|nr:TRAP transporter permease [Geminicoccaceae bacterium]
MATLDLRATQDLEERYDSELKIRKLGPGALWLTLIVLVPFAVYHYWTAGTGIPPEYWHMGIHLAGVLLMVFVCYPAFHAESSFARHPNRPWRVSNVPVWDLVFGLMGVVVALYIGVTWRGLDIDVLGLSVQLQQQALRQGNPAPLDIWMGTACIVLTLEATRRTLGPVLPLIILVFMSYALFGPWIPVQILQHPGVTWGQFINNIYFPAEGIFGITLWVVSTIVFHFVLFGVVAQRMGLGQFFIDIATVIAGKYTGGPAKVSVVSSAFFGTISGSSVANTVSTGSLTIPNMKRLGYPGHFAGGVEAAASAGGQITPPIMGAAAFIMAQNLELPYSQIVIAAAVPALMHYLGVLTIVHFQAKKLGLRGYTKDELPKFWPVFKRGWPTLLPLIVLIYVLFSGYTPYMAAFWGITACIVVGLVNPWHRMTVRELIDAFYMGARYALPVGAAAAAVGIVVGVITTTGVAFRLGFMVTNGALDLADALHFAFSWLPFELFTVEGAQLLFSLIFIAMACVLMGAGLPTTALYIMLAAVAQPALANLGVPPLAAHLFVLYYGVLSEITPPVCTSAYAAGGIAGANPFRTGISAFMLGNAKVLVPMVFVYSPAMLLILPEYFTWGAFLHTTVTCALGIFVLGTALAGFLVHRLAWPLRLLAGASGIALVIPGAESDLWAFALFAPVAVTQYLTSRRTPAPAAAE